MRGSNTCELVLRGLSRSLRTNLILRTEGRRCEAILMSGPRLRAHWCCPAGPVGIMQRLPSTRCFPTCMTASSSARAIGEFPVDAGQAGGYVHGPSTPCRAYLSTPSPAACRPRRGRHVSGLLPRLHPLSTAERATQDGAAGDPGAGRFRLYQRVSNTGRLLRDAKLYEIGAGTSGNPPHADRPRTVQCHLPDKEFCSHANVCTDLESKINSSSTATFARNDTASTCSLPRWTTCATYRWTGCAEGGGERAREKRHARQGQAAAAGTAQMRLLDPRFALPRARHSSRRYGGLRGQRAGQQASSPASDEVCRTSSA